MSPIKIHDASFNTAKGSIKRVVEGNSIHGIFEIINNAYQHYASTNDDN